MFFASMAWLIFFAHFLELVCNVASDDRAHGEGRSHAGSGNHDV
jgi:hypothetical protein